MSHSQFVLRHGPSTELESFPHIKEFALYKSSVIQLESFLERRCEYLQFYFIVDGKFEWIINQKQVELYPGDAGLILPGQKIGGSKGYLGIGTFYSLHLHVGEFTTDGHLKLGKWSNISESECAAIGKIFILNSLPVLKVKEVASILQEMRCELMSQEIGHITRVNHLIDSLLIVIARQSTRQGDTRRDFPLAFMRLEQVLRQNLTHQWTVEEMAAIVGLGTTAFTEKVKSYTGFPPLNYLINIRISEAIKMLKRSTKNATDIALETGFYSSQHFSTTFKKLTGHTPGSFRKSNSPKISSPHE